MGHFLLLCSKQNIVTDCTKDTWKVCQMDDLDSEPTIKEFNEAISKMTSGKTPDSDGIPPKLLSKFNTCLLTRHFIQILKRRCGATRQDYQLVFRSDYNNHRGIFSWNCG